MRPIARTLASRFLEFADRNHIDVVKNPGSSKPMSRSVIIHEDNQSKCHLTPPFEPVSCSTIHEGIRILLAAGLSKFALRAKIVDLCIRKGKTRQQAIREADKHTRGIALPQLRPIFKPIREERRQREDAKEYTRAQIDQLLGNWRRPEVLGKARPHQSKFRDIVLRAYNNTCAVTGSTEVAVLEAAHIKPYGGPLSDDVQNGICLRADIHKLLDANLINFSADFFVSVDLRVSDERYKKYHASKLRLPLREAEWPRLA